MSIFTARQHWLLMLILLLVLGWYWLERDKPAPILVIEQDEPALVSMTTQSPVTSSASSRMIQTVVEKPLIVPEQALEEIQIPFESEELVDWRLERGYPDEINAYGSYDEATLSALAESGDIRAIHTLAERLASRQNLTDTDKAVISGLYRRAVLYGSTFALLHLGVQQETDYKNLPVDDPNRHALALEILATYNLAALRGDRMPNIARGNHFVEQYNIQLTDEDKQLIANRSQEIYTNLSKHRYALALDEFDNSDPDSVVQYFNEVEAIQQKLKDNARKQEQ